MDNVNQRPEEIRIFLEGLLQEAGITPTPELKGMMLDDLEERLQTRLLQVVAENLEPDDLDAFTAKAVEDPAAAQEFLNSKVDNMQELYLKTMAEFRKTFLNI